MFRIALAPHSRAREFLLSRSPDAIEFGSAMDMLSRVDLPKALSMAEEVLARLPEDSVLEGSIRMALRILLRHAPDRGVKRVHDLLKLHTPGIAVPETLRLLMREPRPEDIPFVLEMAKGEFQEPGLIWACLGLQPEATDAALAESLSRCALGEDGLWTEGTERIASLAARAGGAECFAVLVSMMRTENILSGEGKGVLSTYASKLGEILDR